MQNQRAYGIQDTTCTVTIPDTSADPGDTILLPVRVKNLNDVGSIGLYITYNADVLEYINIVNIDSRVTPLYNNEDGVIMFSWFTITTGLTISNATFFEVKFVFKGGITDLNFITEFCDMTSLSTMQQIYVEYNNGGVYQCTEPYPTASIVYEGSTELCEGQSLVLNAVTTPGFTYQWIKNNVPIPGATYTSYAANMAGDYALKVSNQYHCTALSDNIQINVEPIPYITSTTEMTLCGSGTAMLTATASGGKVYWYETPSGIVPLANGNSFTTPVLTSTKTYYVDAVSKGCYDEERKAVVATINPFPEAVITPVGATSVCYGNSVLLRASNSQGYIYQWRNNGVVIQGETRSTYTASSTSNYSVVVTNSYNCTRTSAVETVTINPLPFSIISPMGSLTFCQGNDVVLNGNIGSSLSYQWKKNNVTITGATMSSYTANASGDYTLIVKDINNCSNTSTAVTVMVNALPAASITPDGPTTFCGGGSVNLRANTGSGLTYQWLKDSYFISNATASSYSTDKSGTYNVIVSDINRCSATSQNINVTVNYVPVAVASASGATVFCQGGSVGLTANYTAGLSYQWKNNNVIISGATASSYTANSTGVYTVTETNTNGCTATSNQIEVLVNSLPNAVISGPAYFCSGQTIELSAEYIEGHTYQWLKNNINISDATTNVYSPKSAGSYTLNITNGFSCSRLSNAINVTSYSTPSATVTASGQTTFCDGGSVKLNATYNSSYIYQWRKNNVNIEGATATSYTSNTSGGYSVVVSNITCFNTSNTLTVTVNPIPEANITPSGNASFCQGSNILLTATYGEGYTYQWRKSGSNIANATNSFYVASFAGSYSVRISNGYCLNTSSTTTVTVNTLPIVDLGSDRTIYENETISLDAGGGFSSYLWSNSYNGQILTLSGAELGAGTYTYSVTVTNSNGCSNSDNVKVSVNPLPYYRIDGVVSYDNNSSTPLSNIKIILSSAEGVKLDSVLTNTSGYYAFSNRPNGIYKITAEISRQWGGGDPRDALFINRCFINLITYKNNLRALASDVNSDGKSNTIDALMVNRRYVMLINSFKSGNWLMPAEAIIVNNGNLNKNLKAICYGDADGSYNPPAKLISSINIEPGGDSYIEKNNELSLPFRTTEDLSIGSLGIRLSLNVSGLNVKGIKSDIGDLIYNIDSHGQISIAWSANEKPLIIKSGETLFSLIVEIQSNSSQFNTYDFILNPESFITDIEGKEYMNVNLKIPMPNAVISNKFTTKLTNYPNPFNKTTNFDFTLTGMSFVNIEVFNTVGQKIFDVFSGYLDKGTHHIATDFSALPAGAYSYHLTAKSSFNTIREQKMMIIGK